VAGRITGSEPTSSVPDSYILNYLNYPTLATAEQGGAAALGGTSAVRIVLWLKLANASGSSGHPIVIHSTIS